MELPSIQQLTYLVAYARTGNFTQAAQTANIAQSTLSAQIQKLEETVGASLIERTRKSSHLTPAGVLFAERAAEILGRLAETVALMQEQAAAPVDLHIGVLRTLGDVLMNRHVAHFSEQNHGLTLCIYDMEEEELLAGLKNEHIDLASAYLLRREEFAGYEVVPFARDDLICYAPNLRAADAGAVSRAELAKLPLIAYPSKYFIQDTVAGYFCAGGVTPTVCARLSTPYAMIRYAAAERACALLPHRLLAELGRTECAFPLDPPLSITAVLIYKKNAPKRRAIRTFVDYICGYWAAQGEEQQ
ncbi:MAG: LysR family transcriptional regulator [Mitsuokella sp.]